MKIPLMLFAALILAGTAYAADASKAFESTLYAQAESRDPYGLYRNIGCTWVRKSVSGVTGTTYKRFEVVETGETHAIVKSEACKSDGSVINVRTNGQIRIEFKADARAAQGTPVRRKVEAGEFACVLEEVRAEQDNYRFWHSTEFGGLVVRVETPTETSELAKWWPEGAPAQAAEAEKVDAYALYKKVGRSWTTKTVMTIAGLPDPMISYTKMEVISVDDKGAKVKMTVLDKDKKEIYSADQDIPFMPYESGPGAAPPAPKMTEETIKVEAGEFECYVFENEAGGVKSKSWSSKKYPGLPVKMETDTMKLELIEFKD